MTTPRKSADELARDIKAAALDLADRMKQLTEAELSMNEAKLAKNKAQYQMERAVQAALERMLEESGPEEAK